MSFERKASDPRPVVIAPVGLNMGGNTITQRDATRAAGIAKNINYKVKKQRLSLVRLSRILRMGTLIGNNWKPLLWFISLTTPYSLGLLAATLSGCTIPKSTKVKEFGSNPVSLLCAKIGVCRK